MDDTEKLARQRFMTLNMVRIGGVVFLLLGAANVAGKFAPSIAPWFGYIFLINGIADILIIPNILRKSWAKTDG
jgi:hypothetical protein